MICKNCEKIINKRIEWLKENLQENVNKAGAIMLIKEAFGDIVKKN